MPVRRPSHETAEAPGEGVDILVIPLHHDGRQTTLPVIKRPRGETTTDLGGRDERASCIVGRWRTGDHSCQFRTMNEAARGGVGNIETHSYVAHGLPVGREAIEHEKRGQIDAAAAVVEPLGRRDEPTQPHECLIEPFQIPFVHLCTIHTYEG